ncbi:MAG: hypothetical protein AAF787_17135 [Chloroflexota bacterium]
MTQNLWYSLFLTCGDTAPDPATIANRLTESLTEQGYTPYDPFGILPGSVYDSSVRAFVAPAGGVWVQLLTEAPFPASIVAALTAAHTGLLVRIDAPDTLTVEAHVDGHHAEDTVAALAPYLREGKNAHDLSSALNRTNITIIEPDESQDFLPPGALPDDIQQMAQGVDAGSLNKMFGRVTDGLFGRLGGDSAAAKALVEQSTEMDWNTPTGWKVRALLDMLSVPPGWQQPAFVALRSAYGLHIRRQRKPDARLYPGDAETMKLVPNALDYLPVYAGKNT